jgi:predicted enzyme related to lactoylglutathione lyase
VAAVVDPSGAVISLWQPLSQPGASLVNSVNAHARTELVTEDLGRAKSFYGAVFAWQFAEDAAGSAQVIDLPGPRITMRARVERELLPHGWTPYFLVESMPAAAGAAESLGGTYLGQATEADSALIADPTGAAFAVFADTSG